MWGRIQSDARKILDYSSKITMWGKKQLQNLLVVEQQGGEVFMKGL